MKNITLYLSFFFFLITQLVFGQVNDVEMADTMRSEGKIYVVIAIIGIILCGLFIYLITIDRKVSKLEKRKS